VCPKADFGTEGTLGLGPMMVGGLSIVSTIFSVFFSVSRCFPVASTGWAFGSRVRGSSVELYTQVSESL